MRGVDLELFHVQIREGTLTTGHTHHGARQLGRWLRTLAETDAVIVRLVSHRQRCRCGRDLPIEDRSLDRTCDVCFEARRVAANHRAAAAVRGAVA